MKVYLNVKFIIKSVPLMDLNAFDLGRLIVNSFTAIVLNANLYLTLKLEISKVKVKDKGHNG